MKRSQRRFGKEQYEEKFDDGNTDLNIGGGNTMKKETPFWIRCLDLATILSFGLFIVFRGFDVDSTFLGIDFGNIAGGAFLILLLICVGVGLICPEYEPIAAKVLLHRWHRHL